MRLILPILASALALLLTASAAGEGCKPTTSYPEVDTGETPFGRHYVDNDPCFPESCLFSIWFYTESNGRYGLQRGDEVKDDTCGGQYEADSLTFY